jgi:hypothetical protein
VRVAAFTGHLRCPRTPAAPPSAVLVLPPAGRSRTSPVASARRGAAAGGALALVAVPGAFSLGLALLGAALPPLAAGLGLALATFGGGSAEAGLLASDAGRVGVAAESPWPPVAAAGLAVAAGPAVASAAERFAGGGLPLSTAPPAAGAPAAGAEAVAGREAALACAIAGLLAAGAAGAADAAGAAAGLLPLSLGFPS